jgi:hypothetical protein
MLNRSLLLGLIGFSLLIGTGACKKKSQSKARPEAIPPAYYLENSSCRELMESPRHLSGRALTSIGGICDIVTITDSAKQVDMALISETSIDTEDLKNKYKRARARTEKGIGGEELESLIASALAGARDEVNRSTSELKQEARDRLKEATGTMRPEFLRWADQYAVDQGIAYVERKIIETFEAETDKLVDYGFARLEQEIAALGGLKSPEMAMAAFMPLADLGVNDWQLDRIPNHPFTDELKRQGVSAEEMVRISARAFQTLKDAAREGKSLEDLVRERARRAVSSPEALRESIEKAQIAFGQLKSVAENKEKLINELEKHGQNIQGSLSTIQKVLDENINSDSFSTIRDALGDLKNEPFVDAVIGANDRANLQKFESLLDLADLSYGIIEGDVSLNAESKAKIVALADLVLPDATSREEFKKAINVAQESLDALQAFNEGDWGDLSSGVISIGKQTGIFGSGPQADKVAGVLQVAAQAAISYFTGDVSGMVSSAVSLFGGKKTNGDAANAKRHQEVMEALKVVNSGIQELKQGQEKIYEQTIEIRKTQIEIRQDIRDSTQKIIEATRAGFIELFKGQEATLEGINRLAQGQEEIKKLVSEQMQDIRSQAARNHTDTMRLLTSIQGNINRLAGGIGALLKSDLAVCAVLQQERRKRDPLFFDSKGEFHSFSAFEAFYTKNGNLMETCLKAIQSQIVFVDPSAAADSGIFFPPVTKSVFTAPFEYNESYRLTWQFLRDKRARIHHFYSLTRPVRSRQEMDAKFKVKGAEPRDALMHNHIVSSLDPKGDQNIANPEAVAYVVEQLLASYAYFELLAPDFKPLGMTDLMTKEPEPFHRIGYEKIVREALPMLKAAIAQRQLLRGDLSLPLIAQGECPASAAEFFQMIHSNRMLASNLPAYLLKADEGFSTCGVTYQWDATGNFYRVLNPQAGATPASFIVQRPQVYGVLFADHLTERLVTLQDEVEEALIGYELARDLDRKSLRVYRAIVLHSLSLSR